MPIRTPLPAWAEDHDKATMVRAAPTIKTVFARMATSPQIASFTLATFRQGIGLHHRSENAAKF
jgi:hypothetical protein